MKKNNYALFVVMMSVMFSSCNESKKSSVPLSESDSIEKIEEKSSISKYSALESAIESANEIQIRRIWDEFQLGTFSFDASNNIVEFVYLTYDKEGWDHAVIQGMGEIGLRELRMKLIHEFMQAYEQTKDDAEMEIYGENNPPMYRAVKHILDETINVSAGIRFKHICTSPHHICHILIDCDDIKSAMAMEI